MSHVASYVASHVGLQASRSEAAPSASTLDALARQAFASLRGVAKSNIALVPLLLLWALCNPYYEIDRSSLIYSGRALASLDPAGVGRDIMFVHDGQSSYTVFTVIYRGLAASLGLTSATVLIAACATLVSFAGAVILAGALCDDVHKRRSRLLAIAFAAALPASYGGYKLFAYAEVAATPRPFAEALVLISIAALLRERRGIAVFAMAAACVLHPIMALPGLLVLAVWLAAADRRFLLVIVGLGLAVLALAAWHIGPFDRLFAPLDAAWTSVLVARNPQIFPSLWPDSWMGRFAARAATLLVAASLTRGAVRKLCLLTLAVGAAGLVAAYLVDRHLPLLLTQLQLWRCDWLVFSLATFAGAICVVELWSRGGVSRLVLSLLVLGWIFADHSQAILLDVAALAFHVCLRDTGDVLSERVVKVSTAIAAVLAIAGLCWNEYAVAVSIGAVARERFADAHNTFATVWDYTPLAVLAAICIVGHVVPRRRSLVLALCGCGVVLVGASWDRRSPENRYFDAGLGAGDLRALIDTKPGEVFWIDGQRETWFWLQRPQWLAAVQGAGLIFSRQLSMVYKNRADRAIAAGLADDRILAPFADKPRVPGVVLDAGKVTAFCAADGAPAWLVVPAGRDPPNVLHSVRWTAPIAKLMQVPDAEGMVSWHAVTSYDVIACAR